MLVLIDGLFFFFTPVCALFSSIQQSKYCQTSVLSLLPSFCFKIQLSSCLLLPSWFRHHQAAIMENSLSLTLKYFTSTMVTLTKRIIAIQNTVVPMEIVRHILMFKCKYSCPNLEH